MNIIDKLIHLGTVLYLEFSVNPFEPSTRQKPSASLMTLPDSSYHTKGWTGKTTEPACICVTWGNGIFLY
ncbi:MAG: hypothetical protein K1W30_01915 [Lachnospiraceae bacterium]